METPKIENFDFVIDPDNVFATYRKYVRDDYEICIEPLVGGVYVAIYKIHPLDKTPDLIANKIEIEKDMYDTSEEYTDAAQEAIDMLWSKYFKE